MPALQVRDFPEDLYEELRVYAADRHRSMAQQTIVAVEQMIHGAVPSDSAAAAMLEFEEIKKRADRMAKRERILKRAAKLRETLPPDMPSPVDMLREGREERDRDFDALMGIVLGE